MKVFLKVVNSKGETTYEKAYNKEVEALREANKVLVEYASYKNGLITNISRATFRRNDLAGDKVDITIKYNMGTTYYYSITK